MITILTCIEDDIWLQLPDSFKDFACTYTEGKVGRECSTHCHRELFQSQWRVLLDAEFLQAYEHGIVILCCDGVKRRFYPRIFTYSADYPEKVLIATIRQLGGCPCPRCLIPMGQLHNLGMPRDRQQHATLVRSDSSRSHLVSTACNLIYEKNHGVDSTAVEALLKPDSWNTFSDSLGPFGFDVFVALVVNLLHEFELGVWRMLLLHLLRIICALNKDLIHKLDRRYRQVPPFGRVTIRRFSANTSELLNMAARNFEDLLQCSIPVFDGLFPDNHNTIVIDLLFFRKFKAKVCNAYHTQELDHEVDARSRWQARESAKWVGKGKVGTTVEGTAARKPRADQRAFVCQLTQIECRQSRLCRIKQRQQQQAPLQEVDSAVSDPKLHHHIGQSEKIYDEFGQYLHSHAKDPAMKLEPGRETARLDEECDSILFKCNQIYHHYLARFNYTTYDVRQAQDVINPRTPHCNIMLLKHHDDGNDGNYCYAKVLGIHHVNVVRIGNVYESRRFEFLYV
ncbi:hypothetical protein BDR06DRAFT_982075 [Suillus hirtellus]|nr:hypothetical protein BDR06DRAFT_982075 [Suillus hirtellus]